MNESPGVRMRVALTGLTIAEYLRDEEKKDVLLFIDNVFRFIQAGSEVSSLQGKFLLLEVINPHFPKRSAIFKTASRLLKMALLPRFSVYFYQQMILMIHLQLRRLAI